MSDKGHTRARGSGHRQDGIDEGDVDGLTTGQTDGFDAPEAQGSHPLDQFDAIGRELAKMMRQATESAQQILTEATAEAERIVARAEADGVARRRAADVEDDLRRQQLEAELEPTRAEARASLDEAYSLLQEAQDLDRVTRANATIILESAATRRAAVDEASTSLAALLATVDETMAGWHANAAATREAIARVSSGLREVVDQPDPDLLEAPAAPAPDLADAAPHETTIDLRDPDRRDADLPAPPARIGLHAELEGSDDPAAPRAHDDDDDEALRATVRTAVSRAVDHFMTDISSAR